MKISTEDRFYEDGERLLALRIKYPSEPHGGWPGTPVTVRFWQICDKGKVSFRICSDDEIMAIEQELGEVDVTKLAFIEHQTLGRVVTIM